MEQIVDFIGIENVGGAMVIIVLMGTVFIYLFCCELHFREKKPMADGQTRVIVTKQGIGFCGLLFIVLLLLKVGVVETVAMGWSWIWITAPLWGPVAIIVGILLLTGVMILSCFLCYWLLKLIIYIIDIIKHNRKNKLRRRQKPHTTPPI